MEKNYVINGKNIVVKIYDFVDGEEKDILNIDPLLTCGALSTKVGENAYEIHLDSELMKSLNDYDKHAVAYHELGHILNGDFESLESATLLKNLSMSISREINADRYAALMGYNINIRKIVVAFIKRLTKLLIKSSVTAVKIKSILIAINFLQMMTDVGFGLRCVDYLKRKFK